MKAIRVRQPAGLDNLHLEEIDRASPGPGEILVKSAASSLNYHDYVVVTGVRPAEEGRIPMSDMAGEVVEVGTGVTEFAVGDRVMSMVFPAWQSGEPTHANTWGCIAGDTVDGFASEFVCAPYTTFTRIPKDYSLLEAATLPCAALTAWRALHVEGNLQTGETVLIQGTGGVSIFALQFVKAAGAIAIVTSSSDAKLEKAKALGADHLINYREVPDWGVAAAALCERDGVDHVLELGGPGTLNQSIEACRTRGHISMIGILTGWQGEIATAAMMMKQQRMIGITVAHREDQHAMVRGIEAAGIKPVIDRTFPIEQIADAFRYQESQKHFGKICLEIAPH
jgi:NADPH:quinone reductase-like Zn-dependent oxidoreductase